MFWKFLQSYGAVLARALARREPGCGGGTGYDWHRELDYTVAVCSQTHKLLTSSFHIICLLKHMWIGLWLEFDSCTFRFSTSGTNNDIFNSLQINVWSGYLLSDVTHVYSNNATRFALTAVSVVQPFRLMFASIAYWLFSVPFLPWIIHPCYFFLKEKEKELLTEQLPMLNPRPELRSTLASRK